MSEAEDIMVVNVMEDPEERACREAFEYYDWNKSGTIPFSVKIMNSSYPYIFLSIHTCQSLLFRTFSVP